MHSHSKRWMELRFRDRALAPMARACCRSALVWTKVQRASVSPLMIYVCKYIYIYVPWPATRVVKSSPISTRRCTSSRQNMPSRVWGLVLPQLIVFTQVTNALTGRHANIASKPHKRTRTHKFCLQGFFLLPTPFSLSYKCSSNCWFRSSLVGWAFGRASVDCVCVCVCVCVPRWQCYTRKRCWFCHFVHTLNNNTRVHINV